MISEGLADFLGQGIAISIGTRDQDRVPESAQGWGARARAGSDVVTFFVPIEQAQRTLTNLENNGQIAITISRPSDQRTYQLKGVYSGRRELSAADLELQERYREAFAREVEPEGLYDLIHSVTPGKSVAIEVRVREIFLQTPGPGTGRKLR